MQRKSIAQTRLPDFNPVDEFLAFSYDEKGMSGLLRALRSMPKIQPITRIILPFINSPSFFSDFLTCKNPAFRLFRARFYLLGQSFHPEKLPPEAAAHLYDFLRIRFPSLETIRPDTQVAQLLGIYRTERKRGGKYVRHDRRLDRTATAIAEILLKYKVIDPKLNGQPIAHFGSTELRYSAKLLGERQATENQTAAIRKKFPTLDHVRKGRYSRGLVKFLGLPWPTTSSKVAAALVEQEYLTAQIPNKYVPNVPRASHYFDHSVVREKAATNLQKYVEDHYPHLDAVRRDIILGVALGMKKANRVRELAKTLIARGLIRATIPDGHPLTTGLKRGSFYFDPGIVTASKARKNLRAWIAANIRSHDSIKEPEKLAHVVNQLRIRRGKKLQPAIGRMTSREGLYQILKQRRLAA